jgi:hypothetical protein
VRDRILKLRRPEWITAAEARAPAIERELAAKRAATLLPVAPSFAPAPAAKPAPAAAVKRVVVTSPAKKKK